MKSRDGASRHRLQWRMASALLSLGLLSSAHAQPATARVVGAAPSRTVLVMGDSLSAAYGLAPSQGWVALTSARLARETLPRLRMGAPLRRQHLDCRHAPQGRIERLQNDAHDAAAESAAYFCVIRWIVRETPLGSIRQEVL